MRKIVVSMWITLDGFVAGPDDEMDWLLADDHLQKYERTLVDDAGSLMLGRITHADFASHWPPTAQNPDQPDDVRGYAQRLDALEKIVVSASGNTATWTNTRRLTHLDPDEITELKRGAGGDIVVYGSLTLIRSLADLRLIDELHLLVHPLFLRQGKALFDGGQPPARLELVSAEPFASGVVLLKYHPTDDTRAG
ncbi:dihydrofolate reductase family protein [Micromonospora parathelypteridis]|uniref:Dihydrofolate reductase n=1 Tax=Micromonospora parathelypteridis TaxID=1839617 RepID=A0A840WE94_9ACTN|nr:dihydrofolate reductase family protein [Micromonospora parathelypteridis]MBB5481311.1 dihydrofolate reductase [Micromonospora parathelypteridis]GGO19113.1 pyrimidine reductase [Micromonospora parathelypteridis]